MISLCGLDCCGSCDRREACGGCVATQGNPFGGTCLAAECVKKGGQEEFLALKATLVKEINSLGLKGLQIEDLNLLNGFYVNLEYPLPNGETVKFLNDHNVYLGNQICKHDGSGRCFGLTADENWLLVCEYGDNGSDPEIVVYKRREK